MTRDASRSRRLVPAFATATLAAALLSGCSWMSPVQTDITYAPADGVEVVLGQVKLTNLVVVAADKGATGRLVGQATNEGGSDTEVTIGGQGAKATTVPANSAVNLQNAAIDIPSVDQAPGALAKVTISTPGGGTTQANVPVLAPEGIYADVTPGAAASGGATATDAAVSTQSPTATATPTG